MGLVVDLSDGIIQNMFELADLLPKPIKHLSTTYLNIISNLYNQMGAEMDSSASQIHFGYTLYLLRVFPTYLQPI